MARIYTERKRAVTSGFASAYLRSATITQGLLRPHSLGLATSFQPLASPTYAWGAQTTYAVPDAVFVSAEACVLIHILEHDVFFSEPENTPAIR